MDYTEKNKGKLITIIVISLFLLGLVGFWLQKHFFHNIADIEAEVFPTTLQVGDTLFFKDNTSFSAFREWRFGDGNISINDKGYYMYRKPGYYQVKLTLNGKYSKTFPIQIPSLLLKLLKKLCNLKM